MPLLRPLLLAAIVALSAAVPAGATWTHDPLENLQITSAIYGQFKPQICTDGAGGAIVAWLDNRAASNVYTVYAQHILPTGLVDPTWPVDGLLVSSSKSIQQTLLMIADGSGGAFVSWNDYRTNFTSAVQHVLATGVVDPAWPVNGRPVSNDFASNQSIVRDGTNGVLVAFNDHTSVRLTHVLGGGSLDPAWPSAAILVAPGATTTQRNPFLQNDGSGGAIVIWVQDNATMDVLGTHVLADGTVDPAWPVGGQVLSASTGDEFAFGATPDGTGGIVALIGDERTFPYAPGIDAMHVRHDGTLDPAWPADTRVITSQTSLSWDAVAAPDGSGGALIAWSDTRNGLLSRVFVDRLLSTGLAPGWSPRLVTAQTRGLSAGDQQSNPSITADGTGGAFVTWMDNNGDADGNIFAQHMLASGTVDPQWPPNGLPVCSALGAQKYPVIFRDDRGGAIAAWQDDRIGGNTRVYAQRTDPYGYLGGSEPEITTTDVQPLGADSDIRVTSSASYLQDAPFGVVTSYESFVSAVPAPYAWQSGGTRFADGSTTDTWDFVVPSDGATRWFQIKGYGSGGRVWTSLVSSASALSEPTGVGPEAAPRALSLRAGSNPARGEVTLSIALPRPLTASLSVYDAAGRRVLHMAEAEHAAGSFSIRWDLRDDRGRAVGAGLYFVRLEAGGENRIARLAVMH